MPRQQSALESESRALVLGRVAQGDADLIVHLFTQQHGKIAAYARGARRNSKRFNGALEPMHTLHVQLSQRNHSDLHNLRAADLQQPRLHLATHLDRLNAAGQALRWVRSASPPHTAEPLLWDALEALLNRLDEKETPFSSEALLAVFGLRYLDVLGWGMNLESCVACGKFCPDGRPAWISPERGGLICRACGGGPFQLSDDTRRQLVGAIKNEDAHLTEPSFHLALKIVQRALRAHPGQDGTTHGKGKSFGK